MSKEFLTSKEVSLKGKGYLVNPDGKPIYNDEFVAAQKHAEYVITFAERAKGKDFTGKKAESLEDLKVEVALSLLKKEVKEYVKSPKAPEDTLTSKLKKEALDFIKFDEESDKADKVNEFLSKFDVIAEFEVFGLFFEQNVSKLNKIYTMKEIVKSVTDTIELLD